MSQDRRRGVAWALAAACFGAAFLLPWKAASHYGTSSTALLVLVTTAATFNTALVPFTWRGRSPVRRRHTEALLALGLAVLTLLGNWTSAEAVSRLSPSVLSVLQRSEMLVVALGAWLWLGERVDARFWLGTALAAVGLLVVHGFDADTVHTSGVLLGLASAGCFACMSVLVRRNIEHIDPAFVNMGRLWFSVALWFVVERRFPTSAELNPKLLGYAALAAVFGPSLSRLCLMYSARHVEARFTSLTTLLVPVLTLALTFFLLGDVPEGRQVLGGAIMLIGIAVPMLTRPRGNASV